MQEHWDIILRIEDLDTPRVKPGSVEALITTLARLGMAWSPSAVCSPPGPGVPAPGVLVQSLDLEPYRDAMRQLAARGLTYPCAMSRAEVASASSAPQQGAHETPYPRELRPEIAGHSLDYDSVQREWLGSRAEAPNWRFLLPSQAVRVCDAFAGEREFDLASGVGDFILWTKRDQPSYQLAVVVDDHRQGVTHVVRGDDLLDSAARQILLYHALNLGPLPTHVHLPLVLGADGLRLAKRHGDSRLETYMSRNVPSEAIIGLIARWSIPGVDRGLMRTREFVDRFRLSNLPAGPVIFTPEDDAWLGSFSR